MCKAPKVPKPKDPKKPQFLRNKYLDAFVGDSQAVNALRSGRSSLRIDQANPVPVAPLGTTVDVTGVNDPRNDLGPRPIRGRSRGRGGPRTHLR
jgi:hypothetical protein